MSLLIQRKVATAGVITCEHDDEDDNNNNDDNNNDDADDSADTDDRAQVALLRTIALLIYPHSCADVNTPTTWKRFTTIKRLNTTLSFSSTLFLFN